MTLFMFLSNLLLVHELLPSQRQGINVPSSRDMAEYMGGTQAHYKATESMPHQCAKDPGIERNGLKHNAYMCTRKKWLMTVTQFVFEVIEIWLIHLTHIPKELNFHAQQKNRQSTGQTLFPRSCSVLLQKAQWKHRAQTFPYFQSGPE